MPSGYKIDWSLYDHLIINDLPNMTARQWCHKHAPHISPRTLSSRAKKLNVPIFKYVPTQEHKRKIANTLLKENDEMISFVRENIDKMSRKKLSEHIGLSTARLNDLINRYDIKLTQKGRERARRASATAAIGIEPWNKGKKLSNEHKVKMAIGRQKMSGRLSKLQKSFYMLLDDLNINYLKEDNEACRFGHYLFDCRIIHNHIDILVEVQGDYIHSQPKTKSKDDAKFTYMNRYFPSIPIKYIWEHQFASINKVKQIIRQWLDLNPIELIDFEFSDVIIKQIDKDSASNFLNIHHYLGKLYSGNYIGAFYNDKLIAVSAWGPTTRIETCNRLNCDKRELFELRRFVIHDNFHKKNFATWFMSRCIRQLPKNIKKLVSFSDPSMGHEGTIYTASNWIYDGETQQSYYYIDDDGFVMLKKTLYNKAVNLRMTENEFTTKFGYSKVKTLGKKRFIYNR